MPHYATGEVARVGDVVRALVGEPMVVIVGQVIDVTPGAETCNATVVHGGKPARLSNDTIVLDGASSTVVTCSDVELISRAPAPAGEETAAAAGTAGDATGSGG